MKSFRKNVAAFLADHLIVVCLAFIFAVIVLFAVFGKKAPDGSITFDGNKAQYSETQKQALCKVKEQGDRAVASMLGFDAPQDKGSGCEPTDKELAQMGSGVYYKTDLSSPTAFVNAMNGRGFNEGYGLQCVAGFKQFMFSLSGRVVATRTGGASGYANQVGEIQALGFTWHSGQAGMKDGDWAIFGGGTYGHVAMYYQGKFFGQNQGSGNIYVGNAFNLMDLGSYRNSIIGYYRPNIWAGNNSAPSAPAPQANNSKAVNDQVVADVLRGVYGSGNDRVARLQAAGYNPAEVQSAVNSRVAVQAPRVSAPASTGYIQRNTGGYVVRRGDTLGDIALRNGWHGTNGLFGNSGYTQRLAERNGIANRGLIYPGQRINP